MDNLSDLLAHRNLAEPPEIKLIKDFIRKKFNEEVTVKVGINKITLLVTSSALASNIRMNIPDIQSVCGSNKRIVIYLS